MDVADAPVNIAMEDPSKEAPNINNVLPVELLETLLGLLPPPDLKSAVLVCKDWNTIGEKPDLWTWVKIRVTKENLVDMPKILDLSKFAKVETITLGDMSVKVAMMKELITNEIMDQGAPITWEDIAGLEFAKTRVQELVLWPMRRPKFFTGLRRPPKGLLLFGPPGTGKTLIRKCIASQSGSTFFSISASSLTSKWVGEGEKMVRALFAVAKVNQPSVIFIDEIDSLFSSRSDNEHESSKRIKNEFLLQLDLAGPEWQGGERVLVVGATNRPQELEEALHPLTRGRGWRRLYIPLPEAEARIQIINNLLAKERHEVSEAEVEEVGRQTEGYSGADMVNLCKEAALGPSRSLPFGQMQSVRPDQVRPINFKDLQNALRQVKASVSKQDLDLYLDWDKKFGTWKWK